MLIVLFIFVFYMPFRVAFFPRERLVQQPSALYFATSRRLPEKIARGDRKSSLDSMNKLSPYTAVDIRLIKDLTRYHQRHDLRGVDDAV